MIIWNGNCYAIVWMLDGKYVRFMQKNQYIFNLFEERKREREKNDFDSWNNENVVCFVGCVCMYRFWSFVEIGDGFWFGIWFSIHSFSANNLHPSFIQKVIIIIKLKRLQFKRFHRITFLWCILISLKFGEKTFNNIRSR